MTVHTADVEREVVVGSVEEAVVAFARMLPFLVVACSEVAHSREACRVELVGVVPSSPDASVVVEAPAHTSSEEHTSEIQLLMRSSFAVLCLKKKTTQHNT